MSIVRPLQWLLLVLVIIPENYCKDSHVHGLAAWALAGGVVGRLPRERGPNRRHVPNYGHLVRFDILSIYYCRSLARTSIHLSGRSRVSVFLSHAGRTRTAYFLQTRKGSGLHPVNFRNVSVIISFIFLARKPIIRNTPERCAYPPRPAAAAAAADATATTAAPGGRLHMTYVFDKLSPATQPVCQPASW